MFDHDFAAQFRCAHVEEAERFYTEAFGLTVGRRFGADFVELLGWPAPVYLLAKRTAPSGGGRPRRYERHWTPVHPDIVVDDVDTSVTRAVGAGARLEAPAKDTAYGRIAMLADPFGHGFCLLQFNARATTRCCSLAGPRTSWVAVNRDPVRSCSSGPRASRSLMLMSAPGGERSGRP